MSRSASPNVKTRWLKPALTVAAVVLLLAAARSFGVQELLLRALDWVAELGAWGPLVFIVVYVVACVLFLPGSVLTLGAGALFGVIKGTFVASVAATLGATCAFVVGRYLARDWVVRRIAGNPKFKAIDETVARQGWKIVGLVRLSPVFPFNLLNYAFGLTRVSLRDYFFASWIGMLPGALMYVYIGSVAGDLARLDGAGRTRTTVEWIFYGAGLLATVAVTVYVTRVARRELEKRV